LPLPLDLFSPFQRPEGPLLRRLRAFFQGRGVRAYLVGGYVRDLLLQRSTHDLDLAVCASALVQGRALAEALSGALVPLDRERDIARVVVSRVAGPPWTVDLSSFSGDIAQDLARRDFTVNALAIPLEIVSNEGVLNGVIDPFGGRADLRAGVLRVVAETAFADDPIRLLRAPRLAHQLGITLDAHTEELLRRDAPLLEQEAGERMRDELLRLLQRVRVLDALLLLDRLSLLTRLLPELDARIAAAEGDAGSPEGERRLALLRRQRATLEDIALRRAALERQIESAGLALRNLRLDLIKLRTSGVAAALSDVSTATQEARALSREIGAVMDAAAEVRDL